MDSFILDLLINKREQREWKEIESTMRPVPAKYFNGEPVYEFFQNLDDSLEINLQPIAPVSYTHLTLPTIYSV